MARTRQTSHKSREFDEYAKSNGSDSDSDVEVVKQNETIDRAQVIEGVDIPVLDMTATGTDAAAKLGYPSSKLVSNWYHHQCEEDSCQKRWSEFAVVDEEEADLTARTSSVPIVHRHVYVNKHWITQSVTIQDDSMKKVLIDVLEKYQDLDMEVENWTFTPPFMPLVHRWDVLKDYHKSVTIPSLKNAATVLLAFLAPILAPSVLSFAQTKRTGKVNFDNIWQIFPPNALVLTKFYGVETICRVVKYKERPAELFRNPRGWVIDMEFVDWNGEKCGYAMTSLTIWEYEGSRRVSNLPLRSLSFISDSAKIKTTMIKRGRKFERLRGYNCMICNGSKVLLETEEPEMRSVAGKVCVDAYAYYRSCNIVKPKLRPLFAEDVDDSTDKISEDNELTDTSYEAKFTVAPVELFPRTLCPAERNEDLRPLTDEQAMLATPWLKGFDLKSKDWCELCVDDLIDMVWNDEAFEKLVLPGDEKELAWAFVENKSQSKDGFDDFVPDKGRGIIILMFGPPGVGKTFTAEAVAERSKVPLYSISAGDLGNLPSDVEDALERALELCSMWNAMLLIDEADVFMGARTNESIARNELVSIFLTKLEYYTGILFLTTNRISSIDHAFQSRVDLFLPYHDLSKEARHRVWDNFIDRAGRDKFDVTEESINKLSELNLDGREIKNLIKSAQLLSLKSGGKVPMNRVYKLAEKRVQALKQLNSPGSF